MDVDCQKVLKFTYIMLSFFFCAREYDAPSMIHVDDTSSLVTAHSMVMTQYNSWQPTQTRVSVEGPAQAACLLRGHASSPHASPFLFVSS